MPKAQIKNKYILVSEDDKILHSVAKPYDFSRGSVFDIVENMAAILTKNVGLGLAAPQIGLLDRIFLATKVACDGSMQEYINPEIIEFSKNKVKRLEGCLSFPNLILEVNRSEWILVKYYNKEKVEIEEKLYGMQSICFQHEYDHLNGIVFLDRVSRLRRTLAMKKRKKHA